MAQSQDLLAAAVRAGDVAQVRDLVAAGEGQQSRGIEAALDLGSGVEAALDLNNTTMYDMLEILVSAGRASDTARACMRGDLLLFTFMHKKGYPVDWYECYTGAQVNGHTRMCMFLKLMYPGESYPLYRCATCGVVYEECRRAAYMVHREKCKKAKARLK